MRNKLLALILAFTMAVGLTAMAPVAYAANGAEEVGRDVVLEAAELLMTLNIVQGYEDGSLGLEKNITRAEFAAMLARMLQGTDELNLNAGAIVNTKMSETPENIEAVKAAQDAGLIASAGSAKETIGVGAKNFHTDIDSTDLADPSFSDVSELHWAYNDVEYLRGQGIVTGYTDGTFKPDNNILYEEAVKFVVSALGYDFMAVTYGGYPAGYIKTAGQLKILKNVNGAEGVAVTRQQIMVLLFNSLTADYLVLDKVSGEYNVYETGKNILNHVFGLDIIEKCYVVATEVSGLDSVYHATDKGTIEIGEESELGGAVFKVFNDSYKDLLGYRVKAYVKFDEYNEKKGELYCMFPYAATKKVTLKSEDIINADIDENIVEYYVDEDEEELELAEEPDVIYNGVAYARTVTEDLFDLEAGDITFVSTTGTKVYDLIYINEYIPMYVETIKGSNKTITGTSYFNGSIHENYTVDLNDKKDYDDDREIVVDIIKADGTKGKFSDIKTDTVVYIRMWANHYTVNLGGKLVSGNVAKRGSGYVVVGDTKYKEIEDSEILADYKNGDSVKLGVNMDGYVFYAKAQTSLSALKYGVIMGVAIDEEKYDFEDVLVIKLMDTAGKKQIYPVATDMKFTDMGTKKYRYNDEGKASSVNTEELLAMLKNSAKYASLQNDGSGSSTFKSEARQYEQVVKYSLNAAGEINEIVTAMPSSQVPENADKSAYFTFEDVKIANTTVTGGIIRGTHYVIGSTPLALLPGNSNLDDGRYAMTKESRRGNYGFVLFDVKEDGTVGFAISKNDKSGGAGGKTSGNDGSHTKAFAVIEYMADTVVEFDEELYDGYEIGYIHSGAYKTVPAVIGSGEYPYMRNQGEYFVGDVVNPRLWTNGPYWWDHITLEYDEITGDLGITDAKVSMGYFPIKSILARIIDGSTDMYFRAVDNDTDPDGLGLYEKEVVFGEVVGVANGKILVAYGADGSNIIGCAVSGKKATSYDCETGFVSIVDGTEAQKGDWALLQLSKNEFKSLVIYTNTEYADLDNVQQEENERD